MENLDTLKDLAQKLPDGVQTQALSLIAEMSTVVEGIGDEVIHWKPPYLKLVQGTTDRSSIPKGTAIGDFVIGEKKIAQPFKFIPLRIWDARQYWSPDQNVNKQLCWSPDAKLGYIGLACRTCPHSVWKEEGGSDCGKVKSLLAIDSELSSVFLINFAKSNYKIGLELEGLMKKAGVAPYERVYGLTSSTSPTAKNVENFKIEVLDDKLRKTPREHIDFLKELFSKVSEDRKAQLDAFYAMVEIRKAARQQSDTPALSNETSNSSGSEVTVVEVPQGEQTSSLAKRYEI